MTISLRFQTKESDYKTTQQCTPSSTGFFTVRFLWQYSLSLGLGDTFVNGGAGAWGLFQMLVATFFIFKFHVCLFIIVKHFKVLKAFKDFLGVWFDLIVILIFWLLYMKLSRQFLDNTRKCTNTNKKNCNLHTLAQIAFSRIRKDAL